MSEDIIENNELDKNELEKTELKKSGIEKTEQDKNELDKTGIDENEHNEEKSFEEMLDTFSEENKQNSFEYLLDSYTEGMNEDVQVGDLIKGKIISIGQDTVYIDTKTKIDGAVGKAELFDKDGELPYKVGDPIELYIVSFDESEIILSKAISGIGGLNMLRDAFSNRIPVEGKVEEVIKGGFKVEILGRRAFCPISQMDVKYVETPEDYVGGNHRFLIKTFEDNGKNIVVSRRVILEKELEKIREEKLKEVTVGADLEGQVTKLMPFGAFIELFPGIEGLVHISELSWSRVNTADEVVSKGDNVKVKVIRIEATDQSKPPKISLSIKQIGGDPWHTVNERFKKDEKVIGKVTRLADFGAFVEIEPGVDGLVHLSEMSYLKRVVKAEDVVSIGENVSVIIQGIDIEKRRISLSMKDAVGDPWIDVKEKFPVGQTVKGTIEKKEDFGYFVSLMPGINGLLHKSKIIKSYDPASIEKLKTGDTLMVKVEEINMSDRKIALNVSDATDGENWKQFATADENPMGSLGEKLMQAMHEKKDK